MRDKKADVILWVRISPNMAKKLDAFVSREQKRHRERLVAVTRSSVAREALLLFLDADQREASNASSTDGASK